MSERFSNIPNYSAQAPNDGVPAVVAEFYGLSEDEVIDRLESGSTLAAIADDCGKTRSMLSRWLNADEARSVRAREARQLSAAAWDERAESELREAKDPFELAKAKEIGYHYRWRASKIAPKEYGDKVEHEHKGSVNIIATSQDEKL